MNIGYLIRKINPRPSVKYVSENLNDSLTIIEIGTYEADNALSILKNLHVKKFYCIDPYLNYEAYKDDPIIYTLSNAKKKADKRLLRYMDRVERIYDKSHLCASMFKEGSIDFIYIDGNHKTEYVYSDLERYYPKLKGEGVIAGHDIEHPSVFKAVSAFCFKNNLDCQVRSPDWIIIKPSLSH